jgi:hypothetical protein
LLATDSFPAMEREDQCKLEIFSHRRGSRAQGA